MPDGLRAPTDAEHGVQAGTGGGQGQPASFRASISPECVTMQVHGSCASHSGAGVLLIGPPGSGKSDLVLRLLSRGFDLVADDRVEITAGVAHSVPELAGLLEVRGLGIMRLPHVAEARLALIVELGGPGPRLPLPDRHPELDLPTVWVDAQAASAPERVILALDCALGRVDQVAGAFAA